MRPIDNAKCHAAGQIFNDYVVANRYERDQRKVRIRRLINKQQVPYLQTARLTTGFVFGKSARYKSFHHMSLPIKERVVFYLSAYERQRRSHGAAHSNQGY